MRATGSWSRSHPFEALALSLVLIVAGATPRNVIGDVEGFPALGALQVAVVTLGIVLAQAGSGR